MATRTRGLSPTLKRPREIKVPTLDASDILGRLQKALTSKQRLIEVRRVHNLLISSEDPRESANWLVNAGIIRVITLQLRYVLQRHGSLHVEIEELANLLTTVFQNTETTVLQSELEEENTLESSTACLVEVLPSFYTWNLSSQMTSVLRSLSTTLSGIKMILRSRPLLYRLVDILRSSEVKPETLETTLQIFKNLSFDTHEDKRLILDIPDFVLSLTTLSQGKDKLSAIWRNLSQSIDIRRRLAHDTNILNSLLSLADSGSVYVLRNILNAIISISMESDSCLLLVCHGDGQFINVMKTSLDEEDALVRKRSARVCKLWSSNELSGPILIHNKLLVDKLSALAVSDQDSRVRQEAGEAFCRCSHLVQSPMPQHKAVLDALLNLSNRSALPVEVLVRALRAQASQKENRILMSERTPFILLLADVASVNASGSAKEDACCALADIAAESETLEKLSINPVIDAVSRNAAESYGLCQKFAVLCIIRLALYRKSNRLRLGTNAGLLQALIHYAATTNDFDAKAEVKKVMMMLIAEL